MLTNYRKTFKLVSAIGVEQFIDTFGIPQYKAWANIHQFYHDDPEEWDMHEQILLQLDDSPRHLNDDDDPNLLHAQVPSNKQEIEQENINNIYETQEAIFGDQNTLTNTMLERKKIISESIYPAFKAQKDNEIDWDLIDNEQLPYLRIEKTREDAFKRLQTLTSFKESFRAVLCSITKNGHSLAKKIEDLVNTQVSRWVNSSEHIRTHPIISISVATDLALSQQEITLVRQFLAKLWNTVPRCIWESAAERTDSDPVAHLLQLLLECHTALTPNTNEHLAELADLASLGPSWTSATNTFQFDRITREYKTLVSTLADRNAIGIRITTEIVLKRWDEIGRAHV